MMTIDENTPADSVMTFFFKDAEQFEAQQAILDEHNILYSKKPADDTCKTNFLAVSFSKAEKDPLLTALTNTAMGGPDLSSSVIGLVEASQENKASVKPAR